MYDLNQVVITNDHFDKYCKRNYASETDTDGKCEQSLNPANMFFSDVAPATVDLGLFTPAESMEKLTTCFLSKLTLTDEVRPTYFLASLCTHHLFAYLPSCVSLVS